MDQPGSRSSIADRMAALKKNGEENWKKKIPKISPSVGDRMSVNGGGGGLIVNNDLNVLRRKSDMGGEKPSDADAEIVQLRQKKTSSVIHNRLDIENQQRPVSITDRLSKLQVASTGWEKRVVDKDVKKFTVAGKMESKSSDVDRMNKENRRISTSNKSNFELSSKPPKPRTVKGQKAENVDYAVNHFHEEEIQRASTVEVEVVSFNDGLDDFFGSSKIKEEERIEVDLDCMNPADEFEKVEMRSKRLSGPKRISKPSGPGNRKRTSRNPVKSLTNRADLVKSYQETTTISSADEDSPLSRSSSLRKSGSQRPSSLMSTPTAARRKEKGVHAKFDDAALSGLAEKVDFTNVQLRNKNASELGQSDEFRPYKDLMLLQVKGRRWCQVRVVEPSVKSMNSGDAFLLLNKSNVFVWVGKYANVIERSRAAEMAAHIVKKRELGCKLVNRVITIFEEKTIQGSPSKVESDFFKLLGGGNGNEVKPAGPAEEDEEFEAKLNLANMVWEVKIDAEGYETLKPLTEDGWGSVPKYEFLRPNAVLVIDFGTEVYVYNGKTASFQLRKAGMNLAKKVYDDGYDYEGAEGPNPLLGSKSIRGPRPEWSLLGRINSNMETILFREKFADWPDQAKVSRVVEREIKIAKAIENCMISGEVDVSPFDVKTMLGWPNEDPNLELEGSYLGRGTGYYDKAERREYVVETLSVKTHHVNENAVTELGSEWKAQFHSEDTYVVRWAYRVMLTGRDLKGNPSKHKAVGRDRCVYFFWQGAEAKSSDKGASALMAVEMDKEEAPHIRVDQNKEPAAFMNIWQGRMTVHKGRRGPGGRKFGRQPSLFIVRGECLEEGTLSQVSCRDTSLRSIGTFLLVNGDGDQLTLWHGAGSPAHVRSLAEAVAKNITKDQPREMGVKDGAALSIVEEGQESQEFKNALKFDNVAGPDYVKRLRPPTCSPRLFHMSSVATGTFDVIEVEYPYKKLDVLNVMPFIQSDLYSAVQPGLFFLDAGTKLWLWQGWWPVEEAPPPSPGGGSGEADGNESPVNGDPNHAGSAMVRWHAERRAAMETILDYRRAKYSRGEKKPPMELVWAGCEPEEFTNLFPEWREDFKIEQLNRKYVKSSDLERTFYELSKSEYTWEELQQRPLPDGVDPTRLERYLNAQDFMTHMGICKTEFMTHPRWKQIEIRKQKGLF